MGRDIDVAPICRRDRLGRLTRIDQEPPPISEDKRLRMYGARRARTGIKPYCHPAPNGVRQRGNPGIGGNGGVRPHLEPPSGERHLLADRIGKRLKQLAGGACRCLRHAKFSKPRCRVGEEDRKRFSFVRSKAGEAGTIIEPKLEPAAIALIGHHRQSGLGQRIDIAQDRPRRHFHFGCQLRRIHPATVLEEQKNMQQSCGAHFNHDKRCRITLFRTAGDEEQAMHAVEVQKQIAASPQGIWAVLTDAQILADTFRADRGLVLALDA